MDQQTDEEDIVARHNAFVDEVRQSFAEIESGNGRRFDSIESLLAAIDDADDQS